MCSHSGKALLAALALAPLAGIPHEAKAPPGIQSLAWLAGCWLMPAREGYTEEHWLRPAGGAMLGLSRTIRNGRMAGFEYLALREVEGVLTYIASPSGQATTAFRLTRSTESEWVFENPDHDLPQRIIYRKVPGGMVARIEGVTDGRARSVEFGFRRCD